ncbi:MAG: hypothetical protein IPN58_11920 [Anaerolineales bacterium]|nr:hypothetical protein [Anaerolineales bacterium]
MSQPKKQYSLDIDILKALLVLGMIIVHAISLLADAPTRELTEGFVVVIGLVSFSGFLFSFGYTTWLSYFSSDAPITRILPTVFRIIVTYYISAFIYILFVERAYSKADILRVFTISRMVSYSEFLLAFALTLLLGFLLKHPIRFIMERPRYFFITIFVFSLTIFLPNQWVQSAFLSMFISSSSIYSFPVFVYFPIYLIGMYFARYQIKPNLLLGLAGMAVYFLFNGYLKIVRFPPSLSFILLSMFFLLVWYAIARFLSQWQMVNRLLAPIGVNALFYLLMSNIIIFAFRGAMPKLGGAMTLKTTAEVSVAIIAMIYFMTTIVRQVKIESIEPAKSA